MKHIDSAQLMIADLRTMDADGVIHSAAVPQSAIGQVYLASLQYCAILRAAIEQARNALKTPPRPL